METCQISTTIGTNIHCAVLHDNKPVSIHKSPYGAYQEAELGDVVVMCDGVNMEAVIVQDLDCPITKGKKLIGSQIDELVKALTNYFNLNLWLTQA